MSRDVPNDLIVHGESWKLRLPRAASMRGYGTLFRPAFFSVIFNN